MYGVSSGRFTFPYLHFPILWFMTRQPCGIIYKKNLHVKFTLSNYVAQLACNGKNAAYQYT